MAIKETDPIDGVRHHLRQYERKGDSTLPAIVEHHLNTLIANVLPNFQCAY